MLWLPLFAGVVGLIMPGGESRVTAIIGALATLVLAVVVLVRFDAGTAGLQFVTDETWIRELGIHYKLGVDGLNVFLIVLTTVLFLASAVWATMGEWERPGLFFFWFGLAESGVLGALMAQDLALFVIFFDLMLVPFLFLTGSWGGENRVPAIIKLFIYTLVGSLLMLAAAIATGVLAPGGQISFAFSDLVTRRVSSGSQDWIFLCFALAFLVKMPAFPLHAWVPGAYTAAPTPVVAVLSGVLSKVAAYGFLRIVLPVYPDASINFQELMLVIAVASILYGSVLAFTQTSATLVVAYSSIAQLGFITLGIFSLRDEGAQGAIIQMVNHGLVVAPLFFIIALLSARVGGTDDLRRMGGLAMRAPVLAALFLIVALATLAMPGSANFVGEFLILTGIFKAKVVYAFVAGAGIALAAVYMIRLYQRSMHNPLAPGAESREMSVADGVVIVPIVAVILFLAVYPQFVLERSEFAVSASVKQSQVVIR
jgi:NADH-quinone oxidoreductase subunit M